MITREEIMRLDAGREIDLLVAEQVMGWQLEADRPKLKKLNGYISGAGGRKWWRAPAGGWYCEPPGYSSDIKDGWKVVERMGIIGKSFSLSQNLNGNKVFFDEPDAPEPDYIVEKSLSLAICKAALIACI